MTETESEAKFPVYSKINNITDRDTYNGYTHDYVDLDERQSQTTPPLEYCTMSPLKSPLKFTPTTMVLPTKQRPPRRSLSIGPVVDIHAYRRKRLGSETTSYVDSYLNNFMTTRNTTANAQGGNMSLGTENQGKILETYRSWQPLIDRNGHNCDGMNSGKSVKSFLEDKPNICGLKKNFRFNPRVLAYGITFVVLLALAVSLTIKVIDKYGAANDGNYVRKIQVEKNMLVATKDSTRRKYFNQRQCCQKLKISSTMALSKLYPDLLGVYEIEKISDIENPIFKKGNQNRYLFKPQEDKSAKAHWGWVKAVDSGDCPEDIRYWRVYNEDISSWMLDNSLTVSCTNIL